MDSLRHKVVVREEDAIAEPELLSRANSFESAADVAGEQRLTRWTLWRC